MSFHQALIIQTHFALRDGARLSRTTSNAIATFLTGFLCRDQVPGSRSVQPEMTTGNTFLILYPTNLPTSCAIDRANYLGSLYNYPCIRDLMSTMASISISTRTITAHPRNKPVNSDLHVAQTRPLFTFCDGVPWL